LHEWVIYDYLMARFGERTLRLRCKMKNGALQRRESWVKVTHLKPIQDSLFPDIKEIRLSGSSDARVAEVKFTTSLFDYHRKQSQCVEYANFVDRRGMIVVLKHDHLPSGFLTAPDVFEIDLNDFTSFARENFPRLLSRQIRSHGEMKIWVMYQGPNFNLRTDGVLPARESHIWCPTENLTGFDMAVGDRILFVKTGKASTQVLQKQYLEGKELAGWLLQEIWVGEVVSAIYSRVEYCQIKNLPTTQQLWAKDPIKPSGWRWNRVFEFRPLRSIQRTIDLQAMRRDPQTRGFVDTLVQVFCFGRSREITPNEYLNLLESVSAD
jgi:hypothetical protein